MSDQPRALSALVLSLAFLAPTLVPASSALAVLPAPAPGQSFDAFYVALDALDRAGGTTNPSLRTQRVNVEGARMLLDALPKLQGDDLHRAAAWAKLAEQVQYGALDIALESLPAEHHASPSEAASALLARHGATSNPEAEHALASFDHLAPALREALTRTIDAFLGFEDASTAAFAHADLAKLNEAQHLADFLQRGDSPSYEELQRAPHVGQLGIRWGLIPPARDALLDAAVQLHDVLLMIPVEQLDAVAPIDVPGVLHVDITTTDNVYTTDYGLLIDAGGNDLYMNNAGGGNGEVGYCTTGVPIHVAAALLDFGGNDRFGDGRNCGANGGGAAAAGFLIHAGGSGTYTAGRLGVNGGGYDGAGFLLDAGQDDSYASLGDSLDHEGGQGANGGGATGIGFLADLSGNDAYHGSNGLSSGANGGSYLGAGMLIDGGGDDRYIADTGGVNGGGIIGSGFLLDAGGDNQFTAGGAGANGGGDTGTGLLVSGMGGDDYTATGGGTNGGANQAGVGALIDLGGNDSYTAASDGTNGGNDESLLGLLVDAGGNDAYLAGDIGNGEAAIGCLVPVFLVCVVFTGGVAGLIDLGGHDWYSDAHGSCYDCSVAPKGVVGVQADVPS